MAILDVNSFQYLTPIDLASKAVSATVANPEEGILAEDYFKDDGGILIYVENSDASTDITMTIKSYVASNYNVLEDAEVTIPKGKKVLFELGTRWRFAKPEDQMVKITYSDPTKIKHAILKYVKM